MAALAKLSRAAQIGTLPETRRLLFRIAKRHNVRATASRFAHDRVQFARDLVNPADVLAFARSAIQHPATRELTGVGLMFVPGRYLPIGWAATWATRRIARRVARRKAPAL
jgi:hypothetical protein